MQNSKSRAEELKNQILELTEQYYQVQHRDDSPFTPGQRVAYAGRVFDREEVLNLIDSSLEFWLTSGRYTDQFEAELARKLGVKFSLLVNSGSSANLLAFMALTSPLLKARRINRGDEVITVAAGFPTTIAPIVQYGAVPVFVDVTLPSYNIDVTKLESALSKEGKTKAVFVAHTLGNPFDINAVKKFCETHNLWLIEDNCDALGSRYQVGSDWKYTGTTGDIGTSSFYPPHHLTMGEGGAVYTNNSLLKRILLSLRDWGRDCWCPSGKDNTCGKRFQFQLGDLPLGYDHKYTYSHFGYNLKASDMQAAVGVAQLKKLDTFSEKRKLNFNRYQERLKANNLDTFLILPEKTPNTDPSWFGFALTFKEQYSELRRPLVEFLEAKNIQTRMLFGGNLLKHPCFDDLKQNSPQSFRVVGELSNTDAIMQRTFWLGVYPGLKDGMIDYTCDLMAQFFQGMKK